MVRNKDSILVVDDEIRILRMMQRLLELEGYRIITASDGKTALNAFDEHAPDLVLLDIMLPDIDGCDVCLRIREFSQLPIIMVTAKDKDEEKVKGLDAGADDYITKPFSATELVARVRAAIRRTKIWDKTTTSPTFQTGDLFADFASNKVSVSGKEISLTTNEYRILSYLARNAGRTVTSDDILRNVWGEDYVGETPLVYVNMTRLRKKLEENTDSPKYIFTKPGIGYTLKKS